MMIRCSASAASTALIDFSRETESGRMMNGKTTTSFSGRTGQDVRDREVGVPLARRDLLFFELGHGPLTSYSSCSALTGISISFSRRSGTRGRMTSRRPCFSFVFAWCELTGRGSGTDFTKLPK